METKHNNQTVDRYKLADSILRDKISAFEMTIKSRSTENGLKALNVAEPKSGNKFSDFFESLKRVNSATQHYLLQRMNELDAKFFPESHTLAGKARFLRFLIKRKEYRLAWLNLWTYPLQKLRSRLYPSMNLS